MHSTRDPFNVAVIQGNVMIVPQYVKPQANTLLGVFLNGNFQVVCYTRHCNYSPLISVTVAVSLSDVLNLGTFQVACHTWHCDYCSLTCGTTSHSNDCVLLSRCLSHMVLLLLFTSLQNNLLYDYLMYSARDPFKVAVIQSNVIIVP